jgi:hypothetical protein
VSGAPLLVHRITYTAYSVAHSFLALHPSAPLSTPNVKIITVNEHEDEVLPCADKLAFDTKKEAQNAALVADYQHGTKFKVYKCQHCGLWHLASS